MEKVRQKKSGCRQTRVCAACELKEERILDPVLSAFEHGREWRDPCVRCGSRQFSSTTCAVAELSAAQMEIWSKDKKACFLYQDEQLLLEQIEHIDLFIEYLDKPTTLREKKKKLLAALFVLMDRSLASTRGNADVVDRLVIALASRTSVIKEIGTRHISGRILKRLPPYLNDILAKK